MEDGRPALPNMLGLQRLYQFIGSHPVLIECRKYLEFLVRSMESSTSLPYPDVDFRYTELW